MFKNLLITFFLDQNDVKKGSRTCIQKSEISVSLSLHYRPAHPTVVGANMTITAIIAANRKEAAIIFSRTPRSGWPIVSNITLGSCPMQAWVAI